MSDPRKRPGPRIDIGQVGVTLLLRPNMGDYRPLLHPYMDPASVPQKFGLPGRPLSAHVAWTTVRLKQELLT